MLAEDIIEELSEALGISDQPTLLKRINRGVELLAAKDLFDPLQGYLNFAVSLGNFVALPREVRTVLAVTINEAPAISRDKFYEFDLGTDGSVPGDTLEYTWNDRVNVCVQDERNFPGVLTYVCDSADDNGATATVWGKDTNGRDISEVIVANSVTPTPSTNTFFSIYKVFRSATSGGCSIFCGGVLTGQYYGNETQPSYRSIKLSQAVSSVRIMFRREPQPITSLDSYIPLNSPMAVIQGAKAVGHYMLGEDALGDTCMGRAAQFIEEDQATRQEGDKISQGRQVAGLMGFGLLHSEGITVADIYDTAAEIWPGTARQVLYKKITQGAQVLCNKAHWDGMLGMVDIYPPDNSQVINKFGKAGEAYYVLPRFVGRVLKLNKNSSPMIPRNRWFDFHLNGTGERVRSSPGHWDECGDTVLCALLPRAQDTGLVIPIQFAAVCDNSLDDGKSVMIYGREMLSTGQEVEVWRNNSKGWLCPCQTTIATPASDAPFWVEVSKIERACTKGFVRLYSPVPTVTPGTPEIPATDVTTIPDAAISISGSWTGTAQSLNLYGTLTVAGGFPTGRSILTLFSDSSRTISAGGAGPMDWPGIAGNFDFDSSPVNGSMFHGSITHISGSLSGNFTIVRAYVPDVPATPSVTTWSGGTMFGFWYPDETEPQYQLIRISSDKAHRIRVLYRTRLDRICSLFQPIPLRSTLAFENMLRALKAYEMGMVQNAMPLEAIAVQHLSEDRIKEGESEMPTMEWQGGLIPGGFENIS